MDNELVLICNPLWACSINYIDFDIFHNRIVFDLFDQEHDLSHSLELIDVHSYIWISKSGHPQNNNFETIFNEFSSIVFRITHIESKSNKWLSQYFLDYNLCIEIMDGALLVNLKSLVLDGQAFALE